MKETLKYFSSKRTIKIIYNFIQKQNILQKFHFEVSDKNIKIKLRNYFSQRSYELFELTHSQT